MKTQIFLLFSVCTLVQCIVDLSDMCTQIEQVNCLFDYVSERYETVCASNNRTYQNFCFYSQVRCQLPDVHVIGVGTCEDVLKTTQKPATTVMSTTMKVVTLTSKPPTVISTAPTTMAMTTTPGIPVTTVDHVKEAFCQTKDTVACPTDLDPICASDKTFYLNKCEFSKATCTNPSLVIKGISFCTGIRK